MNHTKSETVIDWQQLLSEAGVSALIDLAILEDIGTGDITTASIFRAPKSTTAQLVTRVPTVCIALPLALSLFRRFDPNLNMSPKFTDGDDVPAGALLAEFHGDVRAILTAERCVLNFLMRLSGVAAAARRAVQAIPSDCDARVFDTRKTTPGWRLLEKAAVRIGGAENHRTGLFDAILIKDNHIAAAGGIREAIGCVKQHAPKHLTIEVEIDRLEQLEEAIACGADIVLLDNFSHANKRKAVLQAGGRVQCEASGGITLATLADVARTGVDRISLGALTHTIVPADLGLDFAP